MGHENTAKYFTLSIFLVGVLVLGSFSGIYAIQTTQDSSSSGVKTIYVAKNGTDRNDGLSPAHPKRNIVNAIESAKPVDRIVVGAGIYQDNLVINKNLTLIGNNQETTIIDGNHVGNCIKIVSNTTVKISGFTIKNGTQGRDLYDTFGGGINNWGNLTLENSTIRDNTAVGAAGIYNQGTISINRVTIRNNHADSDFGGGIFNDRGNLTLKNSTITDNTAYHGGGIYNYGVISSSRVTIRNNHANNGEGRGGGIRNGGTITMEDSEIMDNVAGSEGGGVYNRGLLFLYGVSISSNRAANGGGIMNYHQAYLDDSTVSLINGNIPNNFGGKPYIPA